MLVVYATEFRDNQKDYFDKVAGENQQLIVKRGKDEFLVTKLTEADRISLSPQVIESVKEGLRQLEAGEFREISSGSEL